MGICKSLGKCARNTWLLLGAIIVFIVGLFLATVGHVGSESQSIDVATDLITIESNNGDGVGINVKEIFQIIMGIGILSMFTAMIGCCGVMSRNRVCLSVYSLGALIQGAAFLAIGLWVLSFLAVGGPILQKDVTETCRNDIFPALRKELECSENGLHNTASAATAARMLRILDDTTRQVLGLEDEFDIPYHEAGGEGPRKLQVQTGQQTTDVYKKPVTTTCNHLCKGLASTYNELGDHKCSVLDHMCFNVHKEKLGQGLCRDIDPLAAPMSWETIDYTGALTFDVCFDIWREDLGSRMFSYAQNYCSIVSDHQPLGTSFQWENRVPGDQPVTNLSKVECWERKSPLVVYRVITYGRYVGFGSAGAGLFLILTFICSCCFIVNISKKKESGLCAKLLCPCLPSKSRRVKSEPLHKKLKHRDDSDSESTGSSESGFESD